MTTNTERLAQALRLLSHECDMADPIGYGWKEARKAAHDAIAEHDALASLAPVDGEFLNIANDCRAVATMKMLSVSARARLLLAAEIVEKSSAQVAALTAQCDSHKADAEYRLWRLQQVIPVMQEARDALCALTTVQIKLHHISPTLADRMDAAGTADLERWQATLAAGNGEGV